MQNHNVLCPIVCALSCVLLASCASTSVPRRWLPPAERLPASPYGGWVEIESRQGRTMGELIAVSGDSLFVASDGLSALATADILSARLVTYDQSGFGVLVAMGVVSTLSNGMLLGVTAPMWLIGGSIAATSRSYDPIVDYPERSWAHFVPFARYPQGLPPGLDRAAIRKKGVK